MAETVRIEIPIETIDNTDPELSNITKSFEKMDKAADNAGNAAKKASKNVSQFDKSAEKTQRSLSKWAKEKYEVLLEAKDKISPLLSTIGGGLKSLGSKTWRVTMKAIDLATAPIRGIINLLRNPVFQVGAVLGVSVSLTDTINTYKDFEAAMSKVQAISGATGSELNKLTEKAKEMGATTKFTAEESAEAFNYMAMAGWKTEDMLNGIEGILNLAAASGEDLGTTSDIVTDALTAFNMKASDAGHFADVLAVASSNANTNVSKMGETFKYVGAASGALGYSIEDVALGIGLMANSGIKASQAGTELNSIFTRLSTNTNGARDAIEKLGVSFYKSGKARSFGDVLSDLREKMKGMTDEQQINIANTIAGQRAQAGLLAMVNASAEDYNKLSDAIKNADGAAADMSDTMLDNLSGSITRLQSAVDGVQISFGERLSPYVRGLADWITEQTPAISEGLDELMDKVDIKFEQLKRKFNDMTNGEDWQDADLFGKIKIAWDEFIVDPFSEWWNGTGKQKLADIAGDIGNSIGTGISSGVLMLLGIDVSDTLNEGASIGRSFAQGFSEGFDAKTIKENLGEGIKNLFSSAGKLLPGGESADLSSVFSAFVLSKMASPLIGAGKGLVDVGKVGKSVFGSGEGELGLGSMIIGSAAKGTGLKGLGATMGMIGANLGSQATGAGLIAAGSAATVGGIAGGATLVSSALDLYKSIKSDDQKEQAAYGESAGWKAGGVATGAAIGTMIAPGLGTAIGAGVGGIAGWIKGNSVKNDYEEEVKRAAEEAEKAKKVLEATGFSIDDVTFETKALNDAINDTGVSAETLGEMFQEAVNDKLKSSFGDISLSLEEIQEVAQDIVFDKQVESVEKFTASAQESQEAMKTLQSSIKNLDKLNWKAGLGMKLSDDDIEEYKEAADEMVLEAKEYLESKHYEANVALELLVGEDGAKDMSGSLDSVYSKLQSQLDDLDGKLSKEMNIALKDGVITMDEGKEITNIQSQITDILNKVSEAEEEAKFSSLKIKYGGAALDSESFAQLQEELQTQVDSLSESYDEALEVRLANLNLQLSEEDINEEEYKEMRQTIEDSYNKQIQELQDRVEEFQLDSIAESFGSRLDGILPEIEGSTTEKLTEAMNNALAIDPEPATWTQEQISSWFGLEDLSANTQKAVSQVLQQTAETIPQSIADSLHQNHLNSTFQEMLNEPSMISPFSEAGNTYGKSVTDGVTEGISSNAGSMRTAAESTIANAFANPFSVTAKVNVSANYSLANAYSPSNVLNALSNSSGSGNKPGKNAAGGYVSGGPQLSWLAEEGYGEYIIPTNPSRRTRAIELYEQAGRALGISRHADGGYVPGTANNSYDAFDDGEVPIYTPASAGEGRQTGAEPSVSVQVNMTPEFHISGKEGQSEEDIMQIIKRHLAEMADEIGGEIAENLREAFSNMPVKEA